MSYSPEDDATLRQFYGSIPMLELARMLGRTRNAIIGRANRLGIKAEQAKPKDRTQTWPEGCMFPIGDAVPYSWCNEEKAGRSYCVYHEQLCVRRIKE